MSEPATAAKPSVLLACVHNAGRSQMAATHLGHPGGAPSRSARPVRDEIRARVSGLLAELGVAESGSNS